jgi:hypothetical protein
VSAGATVGSSDVGSSNVGRLKCRGSTVGAQLSGAQLSVYPNDDILHRQCDDAQFIEVHLDERYAMLDQMTLYSGK